MYRRGSKSDLLMFAMVKIALNAIEYFEQKSYSLVFFIFFFEIKNQNVIRQKKLESVSHAREYKTRLTAEYWRIHFF